MFLPKLSPSPCTACGTRGRKMAQMSRATKLIRDHPSSVDVCRVEQCNTRKRLAETRVAGCMCVSVQQRLTGITLRLCRSRFAPPRACVAVVSHAFASPRITPRHFPVAQSNLVRRPSLRQPRRHLSPATQPRSSDSHIACLFLRCFPPTLRTRLFSLSLLLRRTSVFTPWTRYAKKSAEV